MKTTQEIYEANPDEWIALWSTFTGWQHHGVWFKTNTPKFIEEDREYD